MDKPDLFQEKGLLFEDRLRRLFIGTQLAAVGGILNLAFFGNNLIDRSHSLFFRLDFLALVIGVANRGGVISQEWKKVLVMALEEEFETEIPDEEAEKITTVQLAIDYINSNL